MKEMNDKIKKKSTWKHQLTRKTSDKACRRIKRHSGAVMNSELGRYGK